MNDMLKVKQAIKELVDEQVQRIYQSGKRETSGLVDDLKRELQNVSTSLTVHNQEHKATNEHLKRIDDHLDNLNGRVVKNASSIVDLQKAHLIIEPQVKALLADLDIREKELKKVNKKWQERIFWIALVAILFILVKIGVIAPELVDALL